MIIDGHAHVTHADYGCVSLLSRMMDEHGIAKAVLFPGGMIDVRKMTKYVSGSESGIQDYIPNDLVESIFSAEPQKFYGFYCINPNKNNDISQELGDAVRRGFVGLKLAPIVHKFALTSDAVFELAEACGELNIPLYSHVVFSPGASTEKFAALARAFPRTKFVLGHMGFGPADIDAIEVAHDCENVVLESSGGSYMIIKMALERLGPTKLIYGSEFPMQHPQVELEKIRMAATGDAFEQITSKTLLSLFGTPTTTAARDREPHHAT
jgi:predicted TIM-barrel fold metal-dependent hydrolase